MRYQVLTIDGKKMVRQMPEDWNDILIANFIAGSANRSPYAEEFKKMPSFPCELNLPDGTVVEEFKDFLFKHDYPNGYTWGEVPIITAIPLQSKQETQSVTNEGASTATLEELEELVKAEREQQCITFGPEGDKRRDPITEFGFNTCWDLVKPHLSAALLKQKDEKYFEVENDFKIFRELYQKEKLKAEELQSQLTNSREEAIGFAVWMRDNEALVIAENEKTIGWEEMTYDWFYSLYLQSKTEQTNPIK